MPPWRRMPAARSQPPTAALTSRRGGAGAVEEQQERGGAALGAVLPAQSTAVDWRRRWWLRLVGKAKRYVK
eukprot:COSAG02_NODE_34221_length_487_cov_2.121134_1_plen_70_part_01